MATIGLEPNEHDTHLGHDVYIRFWTRDGNGHAGLIETHKTPQGEWCTGSITFDLPVNAVDTRGPKWTVNSMEPLDLSPSVLCRECGHHGFIQQGRWVPA